MSKTRRRIQKKDSHLNFDKYDFYKRSVQSPDSDVEFFLKTYRELKSREPMSLREDFCGTFLVCCEWVKLSKKFKAFGVDLDPEPLSYGRTHYLPKLKSEEQKRVKTMEANVLGPQLPRVDISVACNFSYFIFKSRNLLKKYFANCLKHLNSNGILVLDCFGGSDCQDEIVDETKFRKFTYYWHQESFDPVSNNAIFHIHFKPKGQKKVQNVFSYDWRMWTIPELREVLSEVGFKRSHIYWEGTNRSGGGDGKFKRTEKGEACASWIAYIIAEK